MRAIRARFDGEKIVLPENIRPRIPGEVIVIFPDHSDGDDETATWAKAQSDVFAKVWDNDEDAVYDSL